MWNPSLFFSSLKFTRYRSGENMKCPACEGKGKHHYYVNSLCGICKGVGSLPDERLNNPVCAPCNGTGRHHYYVNSYCTVCDGWGRLPIPVNYATPKTGVIVTMVEAGKPRTAHIELQALLHQIKGIVRVCDPYYGTGTLYRLDLLSRCSEVRFLSRTPDSSEKAILPRAISEFRKEHPNVLFRCSVSTDFHDRFILSDDEIIVLGHGLKDLGNKDSFVIRLPLDFAHDIIDATRNTFNDRWQHAVDIVSKREHR
jgi:hypothetical protein